MNSATRLRADLSLCWVLDLCDEACALVPPGWRERLLFDWVLWARPSQLPPGALGPVRDFVLLEDPDGAEVADGAPADPDGNEPDGNEPGGNEPGAPGPDGRAG